MNYLYYMKSKEVLRLLNLSRVTLMTYLKTGKITATKMANGYYDYDEKSVFSFLKFLSAGFFFPGISTV